MLQLVDGRLPLTRFGPLTPQRQTHASAPARRGVYAFPFVPGGDLWYFAGHRWDRLVPKRLRRASISEVAERDGWDAASVLSHERDEWIRAHSRQFAPKEFTYDGVMYTRMLPDGTVIGHPDFDPDGWYPLNVEEYVKAARRAVPGIDRSRTGTGIQHWSTDHLEVFIPGKIS